MKQPVIAAMLAALSLGAQAQAGTQVSVKDAWARATVPAAKASGAFMLIESKQDARLVGVSSPVAAAELHQMSMENNQMKMAHVDAIELPAGKAVPLAPGGYHVMLMGLKRQLKEGETVPLTLVVENKGGKRENVDVQVQVRPLSYAPPRHP